ncbi:MAG: hypothetical protein ACOCWO_04485 [Candidatus Muiribacteriaceae bacterium]
MRNLALSGTGLSFIDDVESIHINPAGLSGVDNGQIYTYQTEEHSLEELRTSYAALATDIPGFGKFGVSSIEYGSKDYRESTYTISFARTMFDESDIGINIKHLNIDIKNTDSESGLAFDISFTGQLNNAGYALFIRNINAPVVNEEIPREIILGLNFEVSDKANTLVKMSKVESYGDLKNTMGFGIGQVFQLGDNLEAFGSYASNPYRIGGGFNFRLNRKWSFDYAFSSLRHVPPTHAIGFKMDI